jgi:hypothetical protein
MGSKPPLYLAFGSIIVSFVRSVQGSERDPVMQMAAFVTGGVRPMSSGIAFEFVDRRVDVVIGYRGDQSAATSAATELALGVRRRGTPADIVRTGAFLTSERRVS